MYIQGENPAMSDPDLDHARAGLAKLEHLVVQDIFLTETAMMADVVLPASAWPEKTGTVTNTNRQVQMGRKALDLPGDTREDLWIIVELAKRLGPAVDLQSSLGGLRGDEARHAFARQHHVGARWNVNRRSSIPAPSPIIPARRSSSATASRPRPVAPIWCQPICCLPPRCRTTNTRSSS